MRARAIAAACAALLGVAAAAPDAQEPGRYGDSIAATGSEFFPDRPFSELPRAQAALAYSVVIENRTGGVIRVVDPPAQFLLSRPGADIGTVTRPATSVDATGYHASKWGGPMTVVASAVNAVHLKVSDVSDVAGAAVITLLPSQLFGRDLAGAGAPLQDDAIYTSIEGGRGLFGGAWPLIPGNPVSVYRGGRRIYFDKDNRALKSGDVIVIEVRIPAAWPRALLIENRPDGAVVLALEDGGNVGLGTLTKPVSGTGRFAGGVFCDPGGVRATHTAVLDVDFSAQGDTGGLQFIPAAHSLSPELTYSQQSPPYGIIAGAGGKDLRGLAPMFSGFFYPSSGLEAPLRLPRLELRVRLAAGGTAPGQQPVGDGGESVEVGLRPQSAPADAAAVQLLEQQGWVAAPTLSGRAELPELSALRIDWLAPPAP